MPAVGGLWFLHMSTVTAVVIVQRQGHQGVIWIEGTSFHVVEKFEGVWLRLSEDVVCFAPPSPLFLLLCVIIRKCCKRITLVTLATIAHIFAGVYLTCLSSCSCSFCHIFTGKSFVFVCATCGEAIGDGIMLELHQMGESIPLAFD